MSKFSDEEQAELTQIQEYHANKQKIKLLEQQLATARREGWEQAKREADSLLLSLIDIVLESKPAMQSARRAVATMEYGGANEIQMSALR